MIRKVILRNFKRFEEVTFDIPGHVVLAGPNNTGKTTVLQAIASWSLAGVTAFAGVVIIELFPTIQRQ